ncbi:hypothetical protein DM791_08565 [Paenarthrobacter nitroguajacolicus]|nr:hypothetical protein [Paenarthrobacter nitroguajacolicus]
MNSFEESDDEATWDSRPARVAKNHALTVPVRLRDGDLCRNCKGVVSFQDRKSAAAGMFYVSDPANPRVESIFVICRECHNSNVPVSIEPAPVKPLYSAETWLYLSRHGGAGVPKAEVTPDAVTINITGAPEATAEEVASKIVRQCTRKSSAVPTIRVFRMVVQELPEKQWAQFMDKFIHELGLRLSGKDALPYRDWVNALFVAQRALTQEGLAEGVANAEGESATATGGAQLGDDDRNSRGAE